MSETPQEILDRAAPIWDRHVVSFTLVLAALRSVLAERDALGREVAVWRAKEAHQHSCEVKSRDRAEKAEAEVERLRAEGLAIADGQIADRERLERLLRRLVEVSHGRRSRGVPQERADVANVALLDAVRMRGQLRAAEAALLDAQHQEAQDIEALDKLGNAYDAAATAWGRDEAEYIREIAALRGVAR